MTSGKPKTETEIGEILFDAAREGIKASAVKHKCNPSSVYRYQKEYPDFWDRVERDLRPVIRLDAYEIGSLAQKELVKRLVEAPADIGTGQLIGIIRESYSIFERFARIDGMTDPREALLKALKDKDPEIIALVKEILWAIPEGELDQVLNGDDS